MRITINIQDKSKAKTFLEFIKTLDFINVEDDKHNVIPQWQREVTLKRLAEIDKSPNDAIDFDEMLSRLEIRYGL